MKERVPLGLHRLYAWGAHKWFLPHYRALVDRLDSDAGRLLDVGCGPGDLVSEAVRRRPGLRAEGVDLDRRMVRIARRRHGGLQGAAFRVADGKDLPFPDGHFDAAVATETFHHWKDPDAVLAEVHRVLRPGGTLWVLESRSDMDRRVFQEAFDAPRIPGVFLAAKLVFRTHGYSDASMESEVQRRVAAAGFCDVDLERDGAWALVAGVRDGTSRRSGAG